MQRKGEDLTFVHLLARFRNAPPVDADMAFFDKRLRKGSAFDQPDAVKEAVDPQVFTA